MRLETFVQHCIKPKGSFATANHGETSVDKLGKFYKRNFLNPSPTTKNFPVKPTPPPKYFPRTDNFIRQHDNRNVKIVWCRFLRTFSISARVWPAGSQARSSCQHGILGNSKSCLPSSPQSFKGVPRLICRNEGKTEPAKFPVAPA